MTKISSKYKIIIFIFLAFSCILLYLGSYLLIEKIENIEKDLYNRKANENAKRVAALISDKKNSTLALGLIISQNEKAIEFLKDGNIKIDKIKEFSNLLKKYSEYKNVWFHIINKDGKSLYRSWIDKKGDYVNKARVDIQKMIENPTVQSTISVGKFDMSFKSMIPIFDGNDFLGIVEVITHFNSIAKKLQNSNIEPIILVDKRFKSQIKNPFTNLFIDDYYVANLYTKDDSVEFIKKYGADSFWQKDGYEIIDNYFISYYKLQDINNQPMANFVLLHNINDVKTDEIVSFKTMAIALLVLIFLMFIFALFYIYLFLKRKEQDSMNKLLQKNNKELEIKIKNELENSRKKDMVLSSQSRLVAMGEMLGNIAHQWRQPLSAISTAASGMQIKYEFNDLKRDDIMEFTNGIVNNTKYLSQTIEDFRSFFKKDKEKTVFDIYTLLLETYNIIKALYKTNSIEVIFDIDKQIRYLGFKNELSQVFLNLFNNVRDVLIENNIEEKLLYIKVYNEDDWVIIEFHDNGGGVGDEINDKIFDPYFTTKHQSKGTGIGLYMSKEIIVKHFAGEIYNQNSLFEIDDKEYFGANFIIKLPRS